MKENDNKSRWWSQPEVQASLFHYVVEEEPRTLTEWFDRFCKKYRGFFTGEPQPGVDFIPSLYADPLELTLAHARLRTRRVETGVCGVFLVLALASTLFFISHAHTPAISPDDVVFVSEPIFLPYEVIGDGQDGGGGGGGGKQQEEPAATGEIPETAPVQMVAPDPTSPQPLMPVEDMLAQVATVEMPVELKRDMTLPIGDITAPPNYSASSGRGVGGGIGNGIGTGLGSGRGAGVGPGSGGGMGGGSGGGIGQLTGKGVTGSLREPVIIANPTPAYTEEARKARITGTVVLSAILLKDGTLDKIQIVRSLGYGLDDLAIHTVMTKWRFRPGTRNGVPIDWPINIEVGFNIL